MPIVYEKNAFSTPFLSGYKILKIPIVDKCGNPAWPELFPLEKIEQMQQTVGPRHFSAQMMLEFVSPERARLDPGGLHFYDDEFEPRNAKIGEYQVSGTVLYWDPSTGRSKRDGSACVLIYRDDQNRRIFIHDILYLTVSDSEQFPLSRQCDMVIDFMSTRNLNKITVETNGIGIGVPEIMRDCALRRGCNIYVNRVSNNRAKSDRILGAIEPVLSTGRLYAHTRVQKTPLMSEMIGWSPVGYSGHDDGLDAVAGAIAQIPIPVRPLGYAIKTFSANTNFTI
jgi:hypothetical protein